MKGSEFTFDILNLLYYHLQNTSLKRTGSSYIYFPKWLKNNDNNCFQYALTVGLNYQSIKKDPQRSALISIIGKGINFPSKQEKDWRKFESNNKSIALNILFASYNPEEIRRE